MDEVKIIKSSNSKSFPSHPQIETSSRTLSGPTRVTTKFKYASQKHMTGQCPIFESELNGRCPEFVSELLQPDNARALL
jgi:hypothetical protein